MPKTVEPQGWEIAAYSEPELDNNGAYRVIKQIFVDIQRGQSQNAVWADWTGDMLKIHYHSYEMFMPERMKEISARSEEVFKQTVKMLKKEFKDRTGKTLKLVEEKEFADSACEKVSLNQRFYYKIGRAHV